MRRTKRGAAKTAAALLIAGLLACPSVQAALISVTSTVPNQTARTADLSSFIGMDANGTWTLCVQDMLKGSPPATVQSWGLDLRTTPMPEPTTLIAAGVLLLPFAASTMRTLRNSQIRMATGTAV